MKKIISIFILILFLIPLKCSALKKYEDTDSNFLYYIDENNWTELEEKKQNNATVKMWESSCGLIEIMKIDMFPTSNNSINRDIYNYKNNFKKNIESFFSDIGEDELYELKDWSYYNSDNVNFANFLGSYNDPSFQYDLEGYITYNNGYFFSVIFITTTNTNKGECENSVMNIVDSITPISVPKEIIKNEKSSITSKIIATLIISIIFGIVVAIKNVFKKDNKNQEDSKNEKYTNYGIKKEKENKKIINNSINFEVDEKKYNKAIFFYQDHNYEEAIPLFNEYIDQVLELNKNEKHWTTCNNLLEFYIYCYIEQPKEEIGDLNYRINNAYLYLAMIEFEKGNNEQAIANINKGLKYNPVDTKLLFEKAENYKALHDMKNFNSTNQYLYKYIYTKSDLAKYYRNLGYYYIEKKEYDIAKAVYLYSLRFEKNQIVNKELEYIISKSDDTLPTKNRLENILSSKSIPLFIDENVIDIIIKLDNELKNSNNNKSELGKLINKVREELQI